MFNRRLLIDSGGSSKLILRLKSMYTRPTAITFG